MRKLSADAERVLDYLNGMEKGKDFEYAKVVARGVGISPSQLSQTAAALEVRKLIIRRRAGTFTEYSLTEAGKLYVRARSKAIPSHETLKSNPQTQFETLKSVSPNSSEKSKGAHKLMLTIPYQRTITLNELTELAEPYYARDGRGEPIRKQMENQTILVLDYGGRTIELTASSLIAYATPRFVQQDAKVQDLHSELVRETLQGVACLEKEFGDRNPYFKLKLRHAPAGGLEYDYAVSDEHIAFVNDEMARDAQDRGEKVELRHPGTGKICAMVEHSKRTGEGKPIPESEFKGGHTAALTEGVALDHGKKWERFTDALEHKGWDPMIERQARIEMQGVLDNAVATIGKQAEEGLKYEQRLNIHIPVLEEIRLREKAAREKDEVATRLFNQLIEEKKPKPGLRGWIRRRLP